MVTTTTIAYALLYLGRFDATTVLFIPTPTALLEFLQPLSVMLEYEPLSPNLPPLEPVALEMLVIEISSSDSLNPTVNPLLALDSIELDPSETTFSATNHISGCSPRPHWIYTLIILRRHGCRGHGL